MVQDSTPVKKHAVCKSITVEDSFKSCTSVAAAQTVLRILAPDLLHRLAEELQVTSPGFAAGSLAAVSCARCLACS